MTLPRPPLDLEHLEPSDLPALDQVLEAMRLDLEALYGYRLELLSRASPATNDHAA